MTDERRYQEEEIAEIFEVAASTQPAREREVAAAHGLTLAELQSIGREIGVSPERIAEAASSLDRRRRTSPRRSFLGMPLGVARTVELPRAPTDREWEVLVAELRDTFHAQGRESSRGNLRSWTNGNLHAHIEATESGYRLRLGTLKGSAVALNNIGVGGLFFGLVLLIVQLFTGQQDISLPVFLAGGGAASLAYNALRLPRWAAQREEQMDFIIARAQALLDAPQPPNRDTSD